MGIHGTGWRRASFVLLSRRTAGSPTGWAWFFGNEKYTNPWTQVNSNAGWSARSGQSSVVTPDGSIVLMGGMDSSGHYRNDVWRSTDDGKTWTQVNASAGWSARVSFSTVVMPDGSIVIMGGGGLNDTWRFQPAGSSQQHPSHTYTTAGNYSVILQAFNAGGYDSTQKIGSITVTSPVMKVPTGIGTPTSTGHNGRYNDVNGDVVLYFNQMDWIADNEPVAAFNFNGNGQIDFNDIVLLFNTL